MKEETLGSLDKELLTRLAQYFDEKVMSVRGYKIPEMRFRTLPSRAGAERLDLMRAD